MSYRKSLLLTLTSCGFLCSGAASAGALVSPVLSGTYLKAYAETSPGVLEEEVPITSNVSDLLMGTATAAGGNVELGDEADSSAVSTLTGTLDGSTIVLSSLTGTDWTANSNALATRYVKTAFDSIKAVVDPIITGVGLTYNDLIDNSVSLFTATDVIWGRASDPNISYVSSDAGVVSIGIAGESNATSLFETLILDSFTGNAAAFGMQILTAVEAAGLKPQISEVVKVDYAGTSDYYFGTVAVSSGVATNDGSYDVTYEVSFASAVPEPTSILLALPGLILLRRHFA